MTCLLVPAEAVNSTQRGHNNDSQAGEQMKQCRFLGSAGHSGDIHAGA